MAQTTIVPFSTLPACLSSCGPLYDVNGGCVPPARPTADASAYDACFCSDARLAPYSTTTAGVCDAACAADPGGLATLTSWYKSLCGNIGAAAGSTSSSSTGGSGSSSSSSNSGGGGGTWLDGHWRWVVFIVIMVVGIAGIWIGAALWRRSYLRKKDHQYALGKNLERRTGSGQNPYGGAQGGASTPSQGSMRPGRPGVFMPATISEANVYESEKPARTKSKWGVGR